MGVNRKDQRIWDAYFSRHKLSLLDVMRFCRRKKSPTYFVCMYTDFFQPSLPVCIKSSSEPVTHCSVFHPFGWLLKSHCTQNYILLKTVLDTTTSTTMICFIKCIIIHAERGLEIFFPVGLCNYVMLLYCWRNIVEKSSATYRSFRLP